MPISTKRPQDVTVVWNGIPISGFASGTYVEFGRNSDAFALTVGSDGNAARAATADRSGFVRITLLQTSPSNAALSAAAALDEASGDGVGALLVKDLGGADLIAAASAWVKKMPDGEESNEITNRVWELETDNLEIFLGGNPI